MYTNPQCRWNSQATTFYGNQWYTCTHTKTMYDVCAHNSLPTSAILALGLLKKKERKRKMMNNFAWAVIMLFRISGASQAYFGSFKGCYKRGYYCRERLYSQISLKVWDSEEKLAFSSRLPLRRHIAQLGMFSVDPGIVVSFYASAYHPHTILVIDEWMISWTSKDSAIEVGLTVCSRHLVFTSSLHVRLLVTTLQWCLPWYACLMLYVGDVCICMLVICTILVFYSIWVCAHVCDSIVLLLICLSHR